MIPNLLQIGQKKGRAIPSMVPKTQAPGTEPSRQIQKLREKMEQTLTTNLSNVDV